MQLRVARLCLDCEDVHQEEVCPVCGSESFAFMTRWVPAPERRQKPREVATPEAVEAYKRLLAPEPRRRSAARWATGGVIGLATLGIAQWLLRSPGTGSGDEKD